MGLSPPAGYSGSCVQKYHYPPCPSWRISKEQPCSRAFALSIALSCGNVSVVGYSVVNEHFCVLTVLMRNQCNCTILELFCQEVSKKFFIFFSWHEYTDCSTRASCLSQMRNQERLDWRKNTCCGVRSTCAHRAAVGGLLSGGAVALLSRTRSPNRLDGAYRAVFPSVRLIVLPLFVFCVSNTASRTVTARQALSLLTLRPPNVSFTPLCSPDHIFHRIRRQNFEHQLCAED